ncbi:MAG: GT-D fold domain-containing glycosyltransferase [Salinivirgaceae bacterium]|nr:GT-D fold domain-containing glycosyltransferase [Salinivirgaceae bacterium]
MRLLYIILRRLVNRVIWKIFPVSGTKAENVIINNMNKYPVVLSVEDTLQQLINSNKSIARFGDGEFTLCLGRDIEFQKYSITLRHKLLDILKNGTTENCLIAIPNIDSYKLNAYSKRFWFENIWEVCKIIDKTQLYCNARITRDIQQYDFLKIKEIWDNKDIICVTGEGSRFNISHTLFENIRSSTIILSKSKNAWSEYAKILNQVIVSAQQKQFPLVLCALGPTASVLCFELSKINIRALDLGHITNVYDEVIYGALSPEKLPINNKQKNG